MKARNILFCLTLLLAMVACDNRQKSNSTMNARESAPIAATLSEPSPVDMKSELSSQKKEELDKNGSDDETTRGEDIIDKKKIIKDGNISIKTDHIAASKKAIDDLLKSLNAYYESEDLQNDGRTTYYNLKVRIPVDKFELLIIGIESGKDEIVSKNIQARDVTEEFVDIEMRLASKREYLKRYKELLSRSASVKDLMLVEENIRTLQEEIESKEGRLKFLRDQVAFSTLNINLHQVKEFVYKPQEEDKFSERVKKSLSGGWSSIVNFTVWILAIWPLIILAVVFYFVVRRMRRGGVWK